MVSSIKNRADRLLRQFAGNPPDQPRELGPQAAQAAFVFLVTDDARYLDLARTASTPASASTSLLREKKIVNWYSTSRVHATMAWDWLYNHLTDEERRRLHVAAGPRRSTDVLKARPSIYRENMSGYNTGFYGVRNCLWFIGCTAFGTGIETERVERVARLGARRKPEAARPPPKGLRRRRRRRLAHARLRLRRLPLGGAELLLHLALGHRREHRPRLAPRRLACQLRDLELDRRPSPARFSSDTATRPTPTNRLPHPASSTRTWPTSATSTAESAPEAAALARHVQEHAPQPVLLDDAGSSTRSCSPDWMISPPAARARAACPTPGTSTPWGRSSCGPAPAPDDTYCLFTCGGILSPAPPLRRPELRHLPPRLPGPRLGHAVRRSSTTASTWPTTSPRPSPTTASSSTSPANRPHDTGAARSRATTAASTGNSARWSKAFETNDDFVYVAGDATACYQHGDVKTATAKPTCARNASSPPGSSSSSCPTTSSSSTASPPPTRLPQGLAPPHGPRTVNYRSRRSAPTTAKAACSATRCSQPTPC